jgi:uncharacterized integral membrane protein (TIGR00697 family)
MNENRQDYQAETDLKLFSIITGIFTVTLVISNIASAGKIIAFGPLALPGGAVLFPISFIFGDILTEFYGYERSRRVIWTGFASLLLAAITFAAVEALPAASFWRDQETYHKVLGFVPRLTIASLVAYFCGEFANSWVLSKMKYQAKGKRGGKQAWRFIASTIVGEGVDSFVFMTMAFSMVLSLNNMLRTGFTLYLFKVLYEVIFTPFSTRLANWVKKVEGLDAIDRPENINYNPFSVFFKKKPL